MLAATLLAYHGYAPLLLDLRSGEGDDDHVVALFKRRGRWGAISKTNHPVLRWRDPVYKTPRELAMSYFHEYYVWWDRHANKHYGKKTLIEYSKPFDLSRYAPERWVGVKDIEWLAHALDKSPHSPIAPPLVLKNLRKATRIETKMMELTERSRKGKRNI